MGDYFLSSGKSKQSDKWRAKSSDWILACFLLCAFMAVLPGCSNRQSISQAHDLLVPSPTTAELFSTPISQRQPNPLTLRPTLTATSLPPIEPSPTPIPESEICSPLVSAGRSELSGIVSDGFHPPPPGQDGRHQGVDFAYYRKFGRESIAGDGVQAILGGKVAALILDRFPYGNALMTETPALLVPSWLRESLELGQGESLYVLYAHLAELYPSGIGEAISSCQLIGIVGKSGNAGVAHLHLEIRIGEEGQIFPSMAYYVSSASQEERQTYLRWRTSGEFRAIDPMIVLTGNSE